MNSPVTPELRILAAVPRSGSTLFMRVMAENKDLAVTSRIVLMGNMRRNSERGMAGRTFFPDYRVYEGPHVRSPHPVFALASRSNKAPIVSKEELGNDRTNGTKALNECNFALFPDKEAINDTKPVFLFRNPVAVFDSWLSKGWDDLRSFLTAYRTLYRTYQEAKAVCPETFHYTYDRLVQGQEKQVFIFRRICTYWGISFTPAMLRFSCPFGTNFLYWDDREATTYQTTNPKGIFDSVRKHDTIAEKLPGHGLIREKHRSIIVHELGGLYASLQH